MKKILLIGVLLTGLYAAQAQENIVKINILSPAVKTVSLFYERVLSENTSGQLGFFYTGYKEFSGFGITPEWRYYLSDEEVLRGFYLGPFLRYQSFTVSNTYEDFNLSTGGTITREGEAKYSTFGGGVVIGRQWLFKDKISFDLFFGPSYSDGTLKVKNDAEEERFDVDLFDGFGFRWGITLGYAF